MFLAYTWITLFIFQSTYGLQFKSGNRPTSLAAASATSLDVRIEDSNIAKSRKKRSVIFPTGSDLTFDVGLSIPISALSATSNFFFNFCSLLFLLLNLMNRIESLI